MTQLRIQPPRTTGEAMLRKLVPGPNLRDFTITPCPCNHEHYLEFDVGESVSFHSGGWTIRCKGRRMSGDNAVMERCPPQYGPLLSEEDCSKVQRLRDDFQTRYDLVKKIATCAEDMNTFVGLIHVLGECLPLPKGANALMCKVWSWATFFPLTQFTGKKLDAARTILFEMDTLVLPTDPEILENLGALPPVARADAEWQENEVKGIYRVLNSLHEPSVHDDCSDDSSDCSDAEADWTDDRADPVENKLAVVFPSYIDGSQSPRVRAHLLSLGCHVHVIIFWKPQELPFHCMFWVPSPEKFVFVDYMLPAHLAGLAFDDYDCINGTYGPADEPINLLGRGKYMIYRKRGLSRWSCMQLETWELRVCDSSQLEAQLYGPTPRRAPLSSPRSGVNAVASSSSTEVAVSASGNAIASSSKRTGSPAESTSSAKKRKYSAAPRSPLAPSTPPTDDNHPSGPPSGSARHPLNASLVVDNTVH
ncbi:hypothetical protein DFH07DRAFT_783141 [Mycena maculata]|uniref:Uncharacterized protein n=1 Tax=Mycena maculata TaxID=230809 RepID=A0AAD7HQ36_9AGAR|nr:hypothetical protein DFH07DRAFT_783141 [Mycena maculata]